MAQVYRTVSSLSQLLDEFNKRDITFIHSIDDISEFIDSYEKRISKVRDKIRKRVVSDTSQIINDLEKELNQLTNEYNSKLQINEENLNKEISEIDQLINQYSAKTNNIFEKIYHHFLINDLQLRKNALLENFEKKTTFSLRNIKAQILSIKERISVLSNEQHIDNTIDNRIGTIEDKFAIVKSVLDNNNELLTNAMSEQKALDELKRLPDEFYIINNFTYKFDYPIYKKDTAEWIHSIQIDHVIIGASGIFIIETENWSENSNQSIELNKIIEKIRRSKYVINTLLKQTMSDCQLPSFQHKWSLRKTTLRGIVLATNHIPTQEFQDVKIFTLKEIRTRITRHKPVLAENEVKALVTFLSCQSMLNG